MSKRILYFIKSNWLFCIVFTCFFSVIIWYLYTTQAAQAETMFSALTAFGTCSVVILSVFPIKIADNVTGILVQKNDQMYIKLTNKSSYTVYLGYDKILYGTKKLPIIYGYCVEKSGNIRNLVYPAQVLQNDNQKQAELSCVTLCLPIAAKRDFTLPLDGLKNVQVKEIVLYTSNGQAVHIRT